MSICLADRTLGMGDKMGRDLLLAVTTQRPLPEICAASASTQEQELTRVKKMIISSEKKMSGDLDDIFPAFKFYIESCWCSTNRTLIAPVNWMPAVFQELSTQHVRWRVICLKVRETEAHSRSVICAVSSGVRREAGV